MNSPLKERGVACETKLSNPFGAAAAGGLNPGQASDLPDSVDANEDRDPENFNCFRIAVSYRLGNHTVSIIARTFRSAIFIWRSRI